MTLGGVISYDPTLKKPSYKINMLKIASFYVLWGLLGAVTVTALVEKSPRPHRQGVGACSDCVGPPTNIPGGDPAGPPVLGFASPDRPPLGTLSPTASGSGSPFSGSPAKGLFEKSFGSKPRRGKVARGVAGDLLANRSTLPQPPRGRNACYGVLHDGLHGRKPSVPGTPKAWQAGTPWGSVRCRRG
jgi:hypothetical protein